MSMNHAVVRITGKPHPTQPPVSAHVTLHHFVRLPITKGCKLEAFWSEDLVLKVRRARSTDNGNCEAAEHITSRSVRFAAGYVFNDRLQPPPQTFIQVDGLGHAKSATTKL
jgi:hypothetical protein